MQQKLNSLLLTEIVTPMKWGGTYEYTVPFTGNYEITLSGAQGASYDSNSGGYGYTLTKTIRLQYQDKIKVVVGKRLSWSQSGAVVSVPGGEDSNFYLNDQLIWTAAGGAGQITKNIVPNACTSVTVQNGNGSSTGSWTSGSPVHWHSGNGKSGATHSNQFPVLYQLNNPGGCYRGSHTCGKIGSNCHFEHDKDEITHTEHNVYVEGHCNRCGGDYGSATNDEYHGSDTPGGGDIGHTYHTCTYTVTVDCTHWICNGVINTWTIGCGYSQGQVYGYDNSSYSAGSCYYNTSYSYTESTVQRNGSEGGFVFDYVDVSKTLNTTPSASLSRTGNGNFKIRLVEQQELFGGNLVGDGTARAILPYYLNTKCNLILLDHTVIHFKR